MCSLGTDDHSDQERSQSASEIPMHGLSPPSVSSGFMPQDHESSGSGPQITMNDLPSPSVDFGFIPQDHESSGSDPQIPMNGLPPTSVSSGLNLEDHPMIRSSITEDRAADPFLKSREHTCEVRKGSEKSSRNPSQPQPHHQNVLLTWCWELAAIFLSAIAFLAIIITVYPHNGKPLPQWPYSISINALVSIYVLILKATIFFVTAEALSQLKWIWYSKSHVLKDLTSFDEASRGGQGLLILLWDLKGRNLLASCGALVMILMAFVDPFTQQLLQYYNCNTVLSSTKATIPRTNFLDGLGSTSIHNGAESVSVPPTWQNSINTGIFSPGGQINFECLTGNCTFPETYSTVGYCSSCEDVSHELSVVNRTWTQPDPDNVNVTFDGWSLFTSLPSGNFVQSSPLGATINYTTMNPWGISTEIILGKTVGDVINSALGEPQGCGDTSFKNESWRCRGYGAASCSLWPCRKTYSTNVTLGVLQEKLIDFSSGSQWGFPSDANVNYGVLATVDIDCLSVQERAGLKKEGYHIDDRQRWMGYNVTTDIFTTTSNNETYPESMLTHGCLYAFDQVSASSLYCGYIGGTFEGSLYGSYGVEVDPTLLSGTGTVEILKIFFNWGNTSFEHVEGIFQNISDTMTTLTRQTGNSNYSTPAIGTVMHNETCLKVQWPWLAFPATSLLLAWIFFLITLAAQSRKKWLPAWKSSVLPLLFHGLVDPDRYAQVEKLQTGDIAVMRKLAEKLEVQLGKREEGLKLVDA